MPLLMLDKTERLRLPARKVEVLDGSESGPRRFRMKAYSGRAVERSYGSLAIDLNGLTHDRLTGSLLEHEDAKRVGVIDAHEKTAKDGLVLAGYFLDNEHANAIVRDADQGFPWKCSIGVRDMELEEVPAGKTARANGRTFTGPVTIARKCFLYESSWITCLPADLWTQGVVLRAWGFALGERFIDSIRADTAAALKRIRQARPKRAPLEARLVARARRAGVVPDAGFEIVAASPRAVVAGDIIDLAGLEWGELAVCVEHRRIPAGLVSRGRITDQGLKLEGALVATHAAAEALDGRDWGASIRYQELEVERLSSAGSATVNGATVMGPLRIVRRARLIEVSLTKDPQDRYTSAFVWRREGA